MEQKTLILEVPKMNDVSSIFNKQANEIQDMIQKIEQAKRTLDDTWQGEGYLKFNQEMTSEVLPRLKKLQAALSKAATMTNETSQLIVQFAQQASNAVQQGLL